MASRRKATVKRRAACPVCGRQRLDIDPDTGCVAKHSTRLPDDTLTWCQGSGVMVVEPPTPKPPKPPKPPLGSPQNPIRRTGGGSVHTVGGGLPTLGQRKP